MAVYLLTLCLSVGRASAHGRPVMEFSTYQPRIWNQYHLTNRALSNRCLPTVGIADFTRYPLRDASAWWRDDRVRWAHRKHERAQGKTSVCWPAHHSLWLCIHSREGDWEDGGWPYWGGLQMGSWFLDAYLEPVAPASTPPAGYTGPNGWTNAASQYAQERAAENGYRDSGYSRAWLFGQWPNTAPPCA